MTEMVRGVEPPPINRGVEAALLNNLCVLAGDIVYLTDDEKSRLNMRKINYIGLCLLVLTGFEGLFAQFQYAKTIQLQGVRAGAQFIAIAVSEFDDIYLLESQFSEIYRINQEGMILNRNGGFGWGTGQFDHAADLGISGLDILVADRNNHRIVRYDRNLNYITAQDLRSDLHPLIYPVSLAASQINEIFILSVETAEVLRLYIEKNEQTWFGGIEYGSYALNRPVSLRLNEKGILTVLQRDGSLVQFDRFGTPLMLVPNAAEELSEAIGLVCIKNDWLVLSANPAGLRMYDPKEKKWQRPDFSGYQIPQEIASAAFTNERLYLLLTNGAVVVFTYNKMIRKP